MLFTLEIVVQCEDLSQTKPFLCCDHLELSFEFKQTNKQTKTWILPFDKTQNKTKLVFKSLDSDIYKLRV